MNAPLIVTKAHAQLFRDKTDLIEGADFIEQKPVPTGQEIHNCPTCSQRVSKHKITFSKSMATGLLFAYKYALKNNTQTVLISELSKAGLPNVAYARMNDLVRFGLLYKDDSFINGEYGVPKQRIHDFINNNWTVAKHVWRNPLDKRENEISPERIYFRDVPTTAELMEEYGIKMTEYKHNDQLAQYL